MRRKTYRTLRTWVRDMGLGALAFIAIPALAMTIAPDRDGWAVSEASAGEVIATRAIEVSAPPGAVAENAIVAAAQLRPSGDPMFNRKLREMAVLGLTLSLLAAFNLALFRHLHRVNMATKRAQVRRR